MHIIENNNDLKQIQGGDYAVCYLAYDKMMGGRGGMMDLFVCLLLTPLGLLGKYMGEDLLVQNICGRDYEQAKAQYCALHPQSCTEKHR